MAAPLSVIIPTLDAEAGLAKTLASLGDANAGGLIREVIVSDGGSTDKTLAVADEAGCRVVTGTPGRGGQLMRGADAARGPWMLFLHADTALTAGWAQEAAALLAGPDRAGVFRHAFWAAGVPGRIVSFGANVRTLIFKLPYGDQGLIVSKARYAAAGGYEDVALFEDVGLARRLVRAGGRDAIAMLRGSAITSPERYQRDGYTARVWRNQKLVYHYLRGVPHAQLAAMYR